MHELSLVYSIVETVEQAAKQANAKSILSVKLRVGALSGMVKDALLFSYDLTTEGTLLAGSRLDVEEVPVAIYCPRCSRIQVLPGVQSFRCPECDTPSGDIRQGRELDIVSVELQTDQD